MRFVKYAAVLALAIATVACGSKATDPDGTVTSSSSVSTPGWKLAESKGAGISFEVPEGWDTLDFTTGDVTKLIDDMVKENPGMASMGPQLSALAASGKFKMFVGDFAKGPAAGFAENANVLVDEVPAGSTEEDLIKLNTETLKQMNKGVEPKVEKVKLPAGDAYRMESSMEFSRPDGGKYVTYSVAYMFFKGKSITTVTFTALKEKQAEAEPNFKKMADTIKIK